jgi:hypothetical protein
MGGDPKADWEAVEEREASKGGPRDLGPVQELERRIKGWEVD